MNKSIPKQFIAGSCYSHIISSKNEAIVIDPHISLQEEYSKYLEKNKLTLKFIVDTHTDVLLIGSVGRTDFQNGSPESMFETLQKLKALPDETAIFPGVKVMQGGITRL